ncbi:pilus assembly protein [Aliiroseovarius sp. S1339]|uniref:TadE/TadG family type IV pilus assembly protein n=1 Tax=Aliiroseovarius sp. S1339 TaxID=2936990 RepID=UPI0020BD9006|nr:TadE/TadG family type IV pilus assembly protein [Aliiroseovarius sp. S1339]MCK8462523.1 pilus assembly protein [Aliiroseovarius sp. S1339]
MKQVLRKYFRSMRATDGSSTIEFVIWFPLFMTLFLTSFELTFYGMRSVLLERAVDLNVRGMRLGTKRPDNIQELKENICEETMLFSDCERELTVDVRRINTLSWNLPTGPIPCVDRADDFKPPENIVYGPGGGGDLLLIRACMVSNPFFSTTPFVMGLPRDVSGGVSLVAVSTYVNEPS